MKIRRLVSGLSAVALAGTGALVLASASPAAADEITSLDDARAQAAAHVDDTVVEAMAQHFDLSPDGVYDRIAAETVAAEVEQAAVDLLGDSYAGSWVDGADLTVAVVDSVHAADVDALGVTTEVVEHSLAALESTVAAMDGVAADAPAEVHSWGVDVTDNSVTVAAESRADATAFAAAAGVDPSHVDYKESAERPQLLQDIVGGTAYTFGGRCSVGFSATHSTYGDGFLTAGHCGSAGTQITGGTGAPGQVQSAQFPDEDWGWVEAGPSWNASPEVEGIGAVTDGNEAAIGASVCRSGSTTGTHCGEILAKDQTVNYAEGAVHGMTESSACAEPGDSGGPFVAGSSAQGMTSGGMIGCPGSGPIYYEPLDRALSNTGATLTTS